MNLDQIQPFFEDLIRAGQDAARTAPEMTAEEMAKLEADVAAALPVVMNSAPGTYPMDLPHQLALGLVGYLAGATLNYDQETGAITAPGLG